MNRLLIPILTLLILLFLGGLVFFSPTSAEWKEKNSRKNLTPQMGPEQKTADQPPTFGYRIVNRYPHDPNAFTQGLVFVDGFLFEGTGLHGRSSLRKVELATGTILQRINLPARLFGEGVTVFGNKVIQLTWRANLGFVYDKDTFQLIETFHYPTEGWGITHDGEQLIMSDGTSTLYFLHPDTYKRVGLLKVHDRKVPVSALNELEYVQGLIFANVWRTNKIAQISPETGEVLAWIDLRGLLRPQDRVQRVDVLNGIAYDQVNNRLFVTGKLWPRLFEIKLIPPGREARNPGR
ncbi:MAG: glutaminyl-peptide cyclotransferase [Deltaproteobacteria bacterium]|jgi:glutamine cyclotransferase